MSSQFSPVGSIPSLGIAGGSTAFLRPRPNLTVAYANNQKVNNKATVTAATNASPSVITTSAVHNLQVGDWISIPATGQTDAAVGNTAINGEHQVASVPTTTSLTLQDINAVPVAGNGAWSSGGIISQLLFWPQVWRQSGKAVWLVKTRISWQCPGTPANQAANLRLWIYNTPVPLILTTGPGGTADGADFPLDNQNDPYRLGYVDISCNSEAAYSGGGANVVFGQNLTPMLIRSLVTGDLWGVVEIKGAFTPLANAVLRVDLGFDLY